MNCDIKFEWRKVKGVIFDVDGTLYDQRMLRLIMMIELVRYATRNMDSIEDIRILHHFRKVREELAKNETSDASIRQYEIVASRLSITVERVSRVVHMWIYKNPLKYMQICRFDMVDVFFDRLRMDGLKIGIFSDYPVEEKLDALKLRADAICYSLESGIGKLKPQTLGLETIVNRLSLRKSECVYIGDRPSRDGTCAHRLGIPFIHCRGRNFYKNLILSFEKSC